MSSETISSVSIATPAAKAGVLTLWAGRSVVAIGLLHTACFAVWTRSHWSGWAHGDLRGDDLLESAKTLPLVASEAAFWALPGGFAAPLILLGLLMARLGKSEYVLPAYVGWGLGAWILVCSLICEPSGFPLGFIPAGLLIAASRIASSGAPPASPSNPGP